VLGRAVEPRAGEGEGHTHEANCLNCGAPLNGPFCNQCGQHAYVHRTLAAFVHDFAHGVLHLEGKIWRTLPLLAWKPGELTRRYVEGQRASFVSPIALFLFSVFLMFGVLSLTGNAHAPHLGGNRDLAKAEKDKADDIAELQKSRANPDLNSVARGAIDASIHSEEDDLALIQDLRRRGVTEATFKRSRENFSTNVPLIRAGYEKVKQNPDLVLYKLKSNSYKWSWAIIPLSVPFVWLLFPFSRRFRLYDHTVFVTYSLAFMTILVSAGTVIAAAGINAVAPIMLFIPPIHMYRQLRGAYGCTRWGALWRSLVLLIVAIVVLSAFILMMGAIGIFD
jgi:hypothetical protein